MPTAGRIKRGRDVRVVTPAGTQVPSRVLMLGPGDRVKVAFALREGIRRYYVYFGNEDKAAGKPLEIRRGVLLETWENPGGPIETLDQVRAVFRRAGKLLGRGFRDRIFLGHNPFDVTSRVASIFTGWLRCPADGTYTFCTSSTNASFLLIDDKLVVANGGVHPPQRDVSVQGDVELSAGMHKLTFYHASARDRLIAVAAWRPPGRRRIWPIGAGDFAPVVRASPGPMESYGRKLTIDFMPVHLGECYVAGKYFQRYAFKALSAGPAGAAVRWHWDFGDGQACDLAEVEHVYLLGGFYTVKLSARTYAGTLVRTNRLYVSRPWDRLINEKLDSVHQHGRIVSNYDFAGISPRAMIQAVRLFKRAGMPDALLAAGDAFCRRKWAPGWAVHRVLADYSRALVANDEADQAIEALQRALTMTNDPGARATLLTLAGRMLLTEKADDAAALEFFRRAADCVEGHAASQAERDAQIGIGDVWRLRGDYDKALAAYKAAEGPPDPAARAAVRKGDFARYVEDFIRRREFDEARKYLAKWEQAFPTDRLGGYSTLLRVRLLLAEKRYAPAARQAEIMVKVNPYSNYAPQLLMHAATGYAALGQGQKARETLKRLVAEYGESPLAVEAADKLQQEGK